ncbi:MAG: cell division protein ZapE [Thermomicrobiales bacterium]|nr:cell division protein ZapE [Thermomicrobiales bacterium]
MSGGQTDARDVVPPSLRSFVVPPRFDAATFDTYQPDPAYPSQARARDRLVDAVAELSNGTARRGLINRFRRSSSGPSWHALYLDGRFGVGKTHLLAAANHATDVPKAYLSFADLTYAVGAMGMTAAVELLGQAQLICLDEFELDDPGNTMLSTSFVRAVLDRGSRLIVTSNTLPGELGKGRFSADEFQREIGTLAALFESIRIDGDDYRQRRFGANDTLPRIVSSAMLDHVPDVLRWSDLQHMLITVPPLHFSDLIQRYASLAIDGLAPLTDQDMALRFVHFIDKVYDRGMPLLVSSDCQPDDLFPPSYGYGGFERKFRRCQSRLHEMLAQPLSRLTGAELGEEVAGEDSR